MSEQEPVTTRPELGDEHAREAWWRRTLETFGSRADVIRNAAQALALRDAEITQLRELAHTGTSHDRYNDLREMNRVSGRNLFLLGEHLQYTRTNGTRREGYCSQILDLDDLALAHLWPKARHCRFVYRLEIQEPGEERIVRTVCECRLSRVAGETSR